MNDKATKLQAGLYLVATPIGSARDITLRALDILGAADVIAAEDTRNTRHLLDIHGIKLEGRKLVAYHDHNGASVRPSLVEAVRLGKSVAYVSDAGTPMIADPGYSLAEAIRAAGGEVTAAPGPSSVINALTIGGLPTDRFLFGGFIPNASGQRRAILATYADVPATIVHFESGKRVAKTLADIALVLGQERIVSICREMTKKFEEVITGSAGDLIAKLDGQPIRGEVVLLIDRDRKVAGQEDVRSMLKEAMLTMRTKDAAELVATKLGLAKRQVYQTALNLKDDLGD